MATRLSIFERTVLERLDNIQKRIEELFALNSKRIAAVESQIAYERATATSTVSNEARDHYLSRMAEVIADDDNCVGESADGNDLDSDDADFLKSVYEHGRRRGFLTWKQLKAVDQLLDRTGRRPVAVPVSSQLPSEVPGEWERDV